MQDISMPILKDSIMDALEVLIGTESLQWWLFFLLSFGVCVCLGLCVFFIAAASSLVYWMVVLMPFGITWFSYITTSGNIFSPLYSWFVFDVDKGGEIDERYMKSLWDNFLSMKSSNVSYKQTLQIKGGVNLFHFKPIPL